MSTVITEWNDSVTKLMATSGASKEEAEGALYESGGNLNVAIVLLDEKSKTISLKRPPSRVDSGLSPMIPPPRIDTSPSSIDDVSSKAAFGRDDDSAAKRRATPMYTTTSVSATRKASDDSNKVAPLPPVSTIIPDGQNRTASTTPQSRAQIQPRETPPGAVRVPGINGENADSDEDSVTNQTIQSGPIDPKNPVSAELVDEDEERRRIQAQIAREVAAQREQERMEQGRNVCCSTRVKIWTGVAGVVVLVVVVATVLGTVLPRVLDPATSPSTTTTTSPQQGDLQELEMLLSSVSFDNGAALHTQSTPQNDALTWLAGNDNLGNYTDKQKIQRYILAVLFYSTNGKGWQNRDGWLSDDDECLWYNLANSSSCDVNGSVMELDLTDNRLVGKMPNELSLLSESFRHLDLASNSLSGNLPSEVGFLTQLTYLGLFSNSLTGVIPSEIGSLSNLLILRLWGNSLMGTIPSQIALLSKLHELSLNANSLTGTILKDIGLMTNLDWLDLSSNNLMGSIPSEIALLTNLNWLRLHDNNLMGEFTCPALIEMCRISCDTNSDACRSL